ncbi:hypothetical protein [Sporomusa acidovorans]|nr:hypothetical protein [Sporomusa acidovorans]
MQILRAAAQLRPRTNTLLTGWPMLVSQAATRYNNSVVVDS